MGRLRGRGRFLDDTVEEDGMVVKEDSLVTAAGWVNGSATDGYVSRRRYGGIIRVITRVIQVIEQLSIFHWRLT